MLAELSTEELREWEAYCQLEPFGNGWLQTALLASLIANANRNTEEHPEPFEIEDFMPAPAMEMPVETVLTGESGETPENGEEEPPWKAWKRMFQMMADASK